MSWKRLAPIVLAAAVTAMALAAASLSGPMRDWDPRLPARIAGHTL